MALQLVTVLVAIVLIGNLPITKSYPVGNCTDLESTCGVEIYEKYAVVTCNFSANVYDERLKFHLEYAKDDAPGNDAPEIMIACFWKNSNVSCSGDDGYILDSIVFSNVLKFRVKLDHASSGNYTCKTENQRYGVSCRGHQKTTDTTIKPSDVANTDGAQDQTWKTALVVILPVCATVCILVFVYKRRRLEQTPDIEKKPSGKHAPGEPIEEQAPNAQQCMAQRSSNLSKKSRRSNSPEHFNGNSEKEEESEDEEKEPLISKGEKQSSIYEDDASDRILQESPESHSTNDGQQPSRPNSPKQKRGKEEDREDDVEEPLISKGEKQSSIYEDDASDRNLQQSHESHSTNDAHQPSSDKTQSLDDPSYVNNGNCREKEKEENEEAQEQEQEEEEQQEEQEQEQEQEEKEELEQEQEADAEAEEEEEEEKGQQEEKEKEKEKEEEKEKDGKEESVSTESEDNKIDTQPMPPVNILIRKFEDVASDQNLQVSSKSHSTNGKSKQSVSRTISDLTNRKSVEEAKTVDKKKEQGPAKVPKRLSSPGEQAEYQALIAKQSKKQHPANSPRRKPERFTK